MPTLKFLSWALVAFTVELDNEFERRMPHSTTRGGGAGPWLVSMAMWFNCMRYIGAEPIPMSELERLARTKTNLNGMKRWGYVALEGKSIRARPKGLLAKSVWEPLFPEIEQRWVERFGRGKIAELRATLVERVDRIGLRLPDCLPILGYGLFSRGSFEAGHDDVSQLSLPALLSRALLAFAIEFEKEFALSLAISANLLRVLTKEGVRMRDLPGLTGVSKESISMAMGILRKAMLVEEGTVVRLTPSGIKGQEKSRQRIEEIESRFGRVSEYLEEDALFKGIEAPAGGWRAAVRKPDTLPWFPMVLHRGGFPDGS